LGKLERNLLAAKQGGAAMAGQKGRFETWLFFSEVFTRYWLQGVREGKQGFAQWAGMAAEV
jgi:hypothetical protein